MIKRENFDYLGRKFGTLGKKLLAKKARTSIKIVISSWLLLIVFITSALTLFSDQSFKFMPLYSKEDLVHPHEFLFSIASREPENLYRLQRKAQTKPSRPAKPSPGLKEPDQVINIRKLQGNQPEENVLKLFSATADPIRNRVYVAGILTRPIAILDGSTEKWIGTVDSGIDGSALRYLYFDPKANYLYIIDETHQTLRRLAIDKNQLVGPVSLPETVGGVAVDSKRTRLYLTTPSSPAFRAYDGRNLQEIYSLQEISSGAVDMVFDGQGDKIYILNILPGIGELPETKEKTAQKITLKKKTPGQKPRFGQAEISCLDLEKKQIINKISLKLASNERPRWLNYDSQNRRFFLVSSNVVQIFNEQGQEVGSFSIPAEFELQNMLYDATQDSLIILSLERPKDGQVASTGGYIHVYKPSGQLWKSLAVGKKPHRLVYNPANHRLYLPNGDASVLWSIDTNTYEEAKPIRLGDSVEQIVLTNGGRRLFVNSRLGGNYLLSYDLETTKWTTFESGLWPIPIGSDRSGEKLFVVNAWDSSLAIYDVRKGHELINLLPLGFPAGSTDRLPDLAIDSTNRLAFVSYPEFGQIAVIDYANSKIIKTIEVNGFKKGDTGGGPIQLALAVNEKLNLLYALCKDDLCLIIYDGKSNYSPLASVDLSSLDGKAGGGRLAGKTLFVDESKKRLFIQGFELEATTGKPTGKRLEAGEQIVSLDPKTNTYWAVGIGNWGGRLTNILYFLDKDSLTLRGAKVLSPVSGVGESYEADPLRRRFFVGKMTTAEIEIWEVTPQEMSFVPPALKVRPKLIEAREKDTKPASVKETTSEAQPESQRKIPLSGQQKERALLQEKIPGKGEIEARTYWVTNPTSQAQLYAQVILPAKIRGKAPVLILVPGGTGDSREFLRRAPTLVEASLAVVVFDPDGRGKSEGKDDLDGFVHQDGLAALIRFIATLPEIDSEKIGLVTYSYGITMGAGALARYPDLPVKFLIDWEGPANRRYTTHGCRPASPKQKISWPPCSDDAFWSEREAVNFIGQIKCPYLRLQSEKDHAQPTVLHALEMVNAAIKGGVPWVRLNDYPVNKIFNLKEPPTMFPESEDPLLERKIARYAFELFSQQDL